MAITKSSNMLLNIAVDLDGHPMRVGPSNSLDVVALRAAIAAALLTAILVTAGALANMQTTSPGSTLISGPLPVQAPAPGPRHE